MPEAWRGHIRAAGRSPWHCAGIRAWDKLGKALETRLGSLETFHRNGGPSEMIFVRQEEDLVGEGWVDVSGEMQRIEKGSEREQARC